MKPNELFKFMCLLHEFGALKIPIIQYRQLICNHVDLGDGQCSHL